MKKFIKYITLIYNRTAYCVFQIIALVVLILTLFSSCTSDSDLEVPDYKAKLVIHSFISPSDSFVRVNVSTTINIYGKLQNYPLNLPVKVSFIDGDKILSLSPSDNSGTYSVLYHVQPGKEYQLKAVCEGYPDVSATCTVPLSNDFSISVDTLMNKETIDNSGIDPVTVKRDKAVVEFTDVPDQTNYYKIFCKGVSYFKKTYNSLADSAVYTFRQDTEEDEEYKNSKLISDHLIDGKVIISSFICSELFYSNKDSFKIEGLLLETDVHYFKYHSSLLKYEGSDNPFVEFSGLYSNISGGYGIFGAYTIHKKVFRGK
jgi:hypothetical protein